MSKVFDATRKNAQYSAASCVWVACVGDGGSAGGCDIKYIQACLSLTELLQASAVPAVVFTAKKTFSTSCFEMLL